MDLNKFAKRAFSNALKRKKITTRLIWAYKVLRLSKAL